MTIAVPHELKKLYSQGRLVPFIGAGISRGLTWTGPDGDPMRGPSWNELVQEAARQLGFSNPELAFARGTALQILEYYAVKRHGLAQLTNWLYTRMQPDSETLRTSSVHTALARLQNCSLYYTTNYDDFVERSLELHGRAARAIAIEAHMAGNLSADAVEVVKFHGDFNHPDGLVVTETDYKRRLRMEDPLDFRLRADLLNRSILFLGFSFSDPNVSYIFWLANELLGGLPDSHAGRRAYIALTDPSDFEYELFKRRNIEVIAIDSSRRGDCIVELLTELGNEAD